METLSSSDISSITFNSSIFVVEATTYVALWSDILCSGTYSSLILIFEIPTFNNETISFEIMWLHMVYHVCESSNF
jgi:hypothetical protein